MIKKRDKEGEIDKDYRKQERYPLIPLHRKEMKRNIDESKDDLSVSNFSERKGCASSRIQLKYSHYDLG